MTEPRGPILVFDGTCLLCNRSVQFILRRDRAARYRFATMQSATGAALMRAHGLDPDDPDSVLLVDDGRAFVDADAVLRVLVGFGGLYRATALLRVVPAGVRRRTYRWVARHRYRWFGRGDVCMLPAPEQAGRFID